MKKLIEKLKNVFMHPFFKDEKQETTCQNVESVYRQISQNDGPVALDIFGNYIYLGDEVIPVAYNDKRYPYITIRVGFETYLYESVNGPIHRNVIKQTIFFEKYKEGKVLLSKSGDFYHVERQVSVI